VKGTIVQQGYDLFSPSQPVTTLLPKQTGCLLKKPAPEFSALQTSERKSIVKAPSAEKKQR
jgi:hypothetical protein